MDKQHNFEEFRFVVLEIIQILEDKGIDVQRVLLQQEAFWIFKLCTMAPHGLNVNTDYTAFL